MRAYEPIIDAVEGGIFAEYLNRMPATQASFRSPGAPFPSNAHSAWPHPYQAAISRMERKSPAFKETTKKALKGPLCKGMSLGGRVPSFLKPVVKRIPSLGGLMIAPLQRSIAYMLLLQALTLNPEPDLGPDHGCICSGWLRRLRQRIQRTANWPKIQSGWKPHAECLILSPPVTRF